MTSYSYPIELSSVEISGSGITTLLYDSLDAQPAVFLLNAENQTASLIYNSILNATYDSSAEYTLIGSDGTLAVTFAAVTSTGTFQQQASALTLTGSYTLETTPSTFQFAGSDLNISKLYSISQAADSSNNFVLTGVSLNGLQGRALQPVTGAFLVTGQSTTLQIKNGRLVATRGFFGLTGYDLTTQYLASTALPSLRPTKREFIPPTHAINTTKSINGLTYRRMFASTPSGAELRLTYENIPEDDADTLLTLYDTTQGTYRNVTLPAATMAGAEPALQAYLNLNGTDQKWTFAGPPTLESIAPGVSTVTLALRSRIVPPSSRVPLPSLPACEVATPSACYPYAGSGGGASLANVWFPPNTPPEPPPLEPPPTLLFRPLVEEPELIPAMAIGMSFSGEYPTENNDCQNPQDVTVTINYTRTCSFFSDCGTLYTPVCSNYDNIPDTYVFRRVRWLKPKLYIGTCGITSLGVEYLTCSGYGSTNPVTFGFGGTTYGFQVLQGTFNISSVPAA